MKGLKSSTRKERSDYDEEAFAIEIGDEEDRAVLACLAVVFV
jgi:hypothetical protein